VAAYQILANFLLPGTRDTLSEPIGSWNSRGFDDVDARGVVELHRGEVCGTVSRALKACNRS
jgi:hypothetical protein